ncbi:glycosyltransferase family 2 protein [Desulfovibrio sp. OttesenSCG-928-G15]|nr:glycosyltransferase family 2 protein [Desulfovibrio sp. OttesenSCG-928-G15]
MNTPVFSVIIPVFNKWELTRDCLASLREHTSGCDFELIVVDNASTDATATELAPLGETLFGEAFTRIRNAQNENFGPACNRGADAATAPLLFFLNNDTLLTPGWHTPLLDALTNDHTLGAVGPLLVYPDNTVQHLGVAYSAAGFRHVYSGISAEHPLARKKRRLQAITAAALMLPKALFFEAGGFYPEYRNGFEDVELCVRLGQLGKKLTCVAQSRIIHLESQSSGRSSGEQHNAELLSRRCGQLIYPDLHHHGLRDGFQVVINDLLGTSLLVTPKNDAALREKAQGMTVREMTQLLGENPYWLWGTEHLAEALEQEGDYTQAFLQRSAAASMLPTRACRQRQLQTALLTGNTALVEKSREQLDILLAREKDPKLEDKRLDKLISLAIRCNDKLLQGLYEAKRREIRALFA